MHRLRIHHETMAWARRKTEPLDCGTRGYGKGGRREIWMTWGRGMEMGRGGRERGEDGLSGTHRSGTVNTMLSVAAQRPPGVTLGEPEPETGWPFR